MALSHANPSSTFLISFSRWIKTDISEPYSVMTKIGCIFFILEQVNIALLADVMIYLCCFCNILRSLTIQVSQILNEMSCSSQNSWLGTPSPISTDIRWRISSRPDMQEVHICFKWVQSDFGTDFSATKVISWFISTHIHTALGSG